MKNTINKKLISKDSVTSVYQLTKNCEKCSKEFTSNNIFASKYCPECSEEIKREKTRERVKRFREKNKNI